MRNYTRKTIGIAALVFLVVVCVGLLLDLLALSFSRPVVEFLLKKVDSSPFEGKVRLRSLASQSSPPELNARLRLEIQGTRTSDQIQKVACSFGQDPLTRIRTWHHYTTATDGITEFEILNQTEERVTLWEIEQEVAFPLKATVSPVLYPFDQHEAEVGVRCCINVDPPCSHGQMVSFQSIQVNYGTIPLNPGFLPHSRVSEGNLILILERLPFFKIVSLTLLAIALLFLGYLIFVVPTGDDLLKGSLGYFGALWAIRGLIVHQEIAIFPTIVDYAVITLFFMLFFGVFTKTMLQGDRDAS